MHLSIPSLLDLSRFPLPTMFGSSFGRDISSVASSWPAFQHHAAAPRSLASLDFPVDVVPVKSVGVVSRRFASASVPIYGMRRHTPHTVFRSDSCQPLLLHRLSPLTRIILPTSGYPVPSFGSLLRRGHDQCHGLAHRFKASFTLSATPLLQLWSHLTTVHACSWPSCHETLTPFSHLLSELVLPWVPNPQPQLASGCHVLVYRLDLVSQIRWEPV